MTYEELEKRIDDALVYVRLADEYERKEKELKAQLTKTENISKIEEITAELQKVRKKAKRYNDIANKKWEDFEKSAILDNQDERPFYDLLGAIGSVAVDDYRNCCNMLCDGKTPVNMRFSIASQYKEICELFGNGPIMKQLKKEMSERRKRRIRRRVKVYEKTR